LKNARGSTLSASPTVPGVEKCEKNESKRQPNGAGLEILMLRLSVGI